MASCVGSSSAASAVHVHSLEVAVAYTWDAHPAVEEDRMPSFDPDKEMGWDACCPCWESGEALVDRPSWAPTLPVRTLVVQAFDSVGLLGVGRTSSKDLDLFGAVGHMSGMVA